MAPEYAIDGQFSVKSDVFSFGILMLEIVSGKKNRGFYRLNDNLNLVGYVSNNVCISLLQITVGWRMKITYVLKSNRHGDYGKKKGVKN